MTPIRLALWRLPIQYFTTSPSFPQYCRQAISPKREVMIAATVNQASAAATTLRHLRVSSR